ncbi:major facilitator superfamily transporter allantoate [Grosmannia clavigera kw1407]|uniref:Major facilitator superfamily transporter allantoate n=1 Tax=Grosmannia clavigera (strain kw1407 / UAMH 11150) TaxID=655863 RepID=F0XT54_GROCL|nr:major facilitator superfamily transporter allantoate [Grosmannia clavigera kw1407]EFW99123.1 major facilitator superfamily transporter allantoate [Grosmannia clavigera kw1407]
MTELQTKTNSAVDKATVDQVEMCDDGSLAENEAKQKLGHGGDIALAVLGETDEMGEIDPAEEHRLVRKIDRVLLPLFAMSFMFFYVDKTTLSYAAVFGIQKDLRLHGTDYSWLSALFYLGFLAWAVPASMLLQRLPVGRYLSTIFLWGVLLMAQAACHDFAGLAVLRVVGGAAEAVADPAFILVTSMWYTRREQPVKIGLWYCANGLGVAGGGLLGYAIGQIRGLFVAIALPDSPVDGGPRTKNRFGFGFSSFSISRILLPLTARKRRLAVYRLRDNQTGIASPTFKRHHVVEALFDVKTVLFFLIALFHSTTNGGTTNFGTIITKGFGFSTLVTTLLQNPYGACIFLFILSSVFINDRLPPNSRCLVMVAFLLPSIAGAFGLHYVPSDQRVGCLICYYLTGSVTATWVLLLSMQTANVAGHSKKMITSARLFLGYCTGNIAGPFFYKAEQAPVYSLGIWSMVAVLLLETVMILILRFALAAENRRRDRLQGPERRNLDATAFEDLTDKENMNFRYVY